MFPLSFKKLASSLFLVLTTVHNQLKILKKMVGDLGLIWYSPLFFMQKAFDCQCLVIFAWLFLLHFGLGVFFKKCYNGLVV